MHCCSLTISVLLNKKLRFFKSTVAFCQWLQYFQSWVSISINSFLPFSLFGLDFLVRILLAVMFTCRGCGIGANPCFQGALTALFCVEMLAVTFVMMVLEFYFLVERWTDHYLLGDFQIRTNVGNPDGGGRVRAQNFLFQFRHADLGELTSFLHVEEILKIYNLY